MSGVAVIGGSGGLGAACAERISRRTPVMVGYNTRRDAAEQIAAGIRAEGGRVEVGAIDVTDPVSVEAFLRNAESAFEGLDGVVVATGSYSYPFCPLREVSEDDFRRILDTDVLGTFNILKSATGILADSGGGTIVLFLTVAVLRPTELDGMSGIPKTAVAGMLKQAAREEGPFNIRVNGIAPGLIDAGAVTNLMVSEVALNMLERVEKQTPLARRGRAEEIGAVADFLSSPDSSFVTGQIVAVDGGFSV